MVSTLLSRTLDLHEDVAEILVTRAEVRHARFIEFRGRVGARGWVRGRVGMPRPWRA